ncbi:hypothetical protein F511_03925 [Dorcoceras hygrometricum]|uniref:Uncharacterized protein n=1 Tax=Dorcoceras hygrometricum TaxID=472368 RepID=A0A2Z7D2V4_9LAMI|nr:hypothetical protein F511_03925 [Dorcoceras hygrometricum]
MEHIGMNSMFQSLEDTGLKGFLKYTTSVFENVVTEFFLNAKVIAGTIVSVVCNKKLAITEDKVLTNKSVQTYIKKNLEIKPAGESSKHTEDTASNTDGGESQVEQPVEKEKDPCPIPEELVGGAEASGNKQVDDGPGGDERTDSEHDVQRGGDDDPSAKGNETLVVFDKPTPIKEHCQLVLRSVWDVVSERMAIFDAWIHFRKEDASIDSKMHSMESKLHSMNSNIEQLMHTQTFLKLEFGCYKHIIYDKQQQLTTDLDMVRMKLAELVEHLKQVGDAKKGEGREMLERESTLTPVDVLHIRSSLEFLTCFGGPELLVES